MAITGRGFPSHPIAQSKALAASVVVIVVVEAAPPVSAQVI